MDELVNAEVNRGDNAEPVKAAQNAQAVAWVQRVMDAKGNKRIKNAFKQIRKNIEFVGGDQWEHMAEDDPRYVANITLRHIMQRRAALYARNPTAVAKRRNTLDFEIWDGDPASLQNASLMLQEAGAQGMDLSQAAGTNMQPLVEAMALIQDYQQGMQRRRMLDRMAKTLEILWEHQVGEQQPPFKTSMKQLVGRTLVAGVGYLKLGFHRLSEYRPEDVERITDITEQIAALETALSEQEDGDLDPESPDRAELENLLKVVTEEAEAFVREGLDLDFPRATSIIPDPACRSLKGFLGARWVAQEFLLTTRQVHDAYGVDLAKQDEAVRYAPDGARLTSGALPGDDGDRSKDRYQVFEVYDKRTRTVLTVCEGYGQFLSAPQAPAVKLERFWPIFTLIFNDVEMEDDLYPPSDVQLLMPMQTELNLTRQRLREHRDAARPGHVSTKGRFDDDDASALEDREAHKVVLLNTLAEGEDIKKVLQSIPTNPIDPNLYETGTIQEDVLQTVGTQEAVLGGTSGATATESSIAESSRLSSIGENVDELDDFLSEVARSGSHLLLSEFSLDFVRKIVGPGAVWPESTAPEVAKDLWLEVRAGSSGRPNKAMELQNLERVLPFLLQIPGVPPQKVLAEILDRLDDRMKVEDMYEAGLPSIMSMNRMAQPMTGDPGRDPGAQGAEGSDKNAVEQGDSNMGPRPPAENRNMDPNLQ